MNQVILIGNLANNPEVRKTPNGVSTCMFRLAVQRRYKNPQTGKADADFLTIIAWRQLAELCGRYLTKGRKCAVTGSIQTRSYAAQDGSKRYVTEIVADSVEFLGGRNETGADESGAAGEAPPDAGFTLADISDDELPF